MIVALVPTFTVAIAKATVPFVLEILTIPSCL
jgi:hypothetical protein